MVLKAALVCVVCFVLFAAVQLSSTKLVQRRVVKDKRQTQNCYYEGKPYPVGEFLPQENCTMACFCNGDGPPSPCFPMCGPVRVPSCKVAEELFTYYEKNEYGCPCKMTACRKLNYQ